MAETPTASFKVNRAIFNAETEFPGTWPGFAFKVAGHPIHKTEVSPSITHWCHENSGKFAALYINELG